MEGHILKVTFKERDKGDEGANSTSMWRKSILSRGNSRCAGPKEHVWNVGVKQGYCCGWSGLSRGV